jgi:hypothetical protein
MTAKKEKVAMESTKNQPLLHIKKVNPIKLANADKTQKIALGGGCIPTGNPPDRD